MVYVLPDLPRFGGHFLALSQGQLSLFRYIVDAYLSGEIVSGGDVLAVARRDNSADGRSHSPAFNPFLAEESVGQRWRRYAGYALVLAIGVGLAAFVGMGVQERFLTVASDTAVIEAPLYRLKAPTGGTLGSAVQPDAILHPGDPVARITPNGGQPVTVVEPVRVLGPRVDGRPGPVRPGGRSGRHPGRGRPAAGRAGAGAVGQAKNLKVGEVAETTVPGRPEPYRGQIDSIDFKVPLSGRRPDDQLLPADRRSAVVIVRPDTPFDFTDLGSLVSVRFH